MNPDGWDRARMMALAPLLMADAFASAPIQRREPEEGPPTTPPHSDNVGDPPMNRQQRRRAERMARR